MSLAASTLNGDFSEIPETLYAPRKRLAWAYSILRTLKNPKVLDVGCGTEDLLTIRSQDVASILSAPTFIENRSNMRKPRRLDSRMSISFAARRKTLLDNTMQSFFPRSLSSR
jgi:hypothetical protein